MAHGVGVLYLVIETIMENRPLLYIGLPGFIMCVIGVFFGILMLAPTESDPVLLACVCDAGLDFYDPWCDRAIYGVDFPCNCKVEGAGR
jgi:hypothetical protein